MAKININYNFELAELYRSRLTLAADLVSELPLLSELKVIGSFAVAATCYPREPKAMVANDIDLLYNASEWEIDELLELLGDAGWTGGEAYGESEIISCKKGEVNLLLAITEDEFELRLLSNTVACNTHNEKYAWLDQRKKSVRVNTHSYFCTRRTMN